MKIITQVNVHFESIFCLSEFDFDYVNVKIIFVDKKLLMLNHFLIPIYRIIRWLDFPTNVILIYATYVNLIFYSSITLAQTFVDGNIVATLLKKNHENSIISSQVTETISCGDLSLLLDGKSTVEVLA